MKFDLITFIFSILFAFTLSYALWDGHLVLTLITFILLIIIGILTGIIANILDKSGIDL